MLTCFCSGCCAAAPSIARAANGRSAASSASSRLRFGPLPAQGLRSVMDRTELATDELAEHTIDRDYVQQCSAPSETTWGTPGVELRGEAAAVTLQRRRWSSWPTQALSPGTAVQNSGLRSHTCRMCPDTLRLIEGIPLMHSGRGASRLAPGHKRSNALRPPRAGIPHALGGRLFGARATAGRTVGSPDITPQTHAEAE